MKIKKQSGITLVALVVTIVVLLILAAVSINLVLGENGLITNAKDAKSKSADAMNEENYLVNGAIPNYIAEQVTGSVTISETKITKANLGNYLGKKVQYTPANPSADYGTSTTYRLFYVDFDNDFGDGSGTIYLQAENDGKIKSLPSSHTSSDNLTIMKKINPGWKDNSGTLDGANDNAVAWLTDPDVWKDWKDTSLASKINYVIGSTSLEMYVKSYNAYLEANSILKDVAGNTASKLECKFDTINKYGYKVGVVEDKYVTNNGDYLAENVLITSTEAQIYNPGLGKYHWLASPSAVSGYSLMLASGNSNRVTYTNYNNGGSICPLVSIKPDATLTFVNE